MRMEPIPGTSAEVLQDEYVLSIKDLLRVLWRRLWIIALIAVVFAGAAVGLALWQTPIYQASITILVGQESPGNNLQSDVQGLQQTIQTMVEAIQSRPVAEAVIREEDLDLSPESLLANLSAQQAREETYFIEVSYNDTSPEEARQIANAVGDVFSQRVSEISPGNSTLTATVWERAVTPTSPVSPQPVRDGILALALGGMLGIGLAFLLEYLDARWRSPEEAERVAGVPTFGVIPKFDLPKAKKGGA